MPVALTMKGGCNRSTSQFLKLDMSNIIYFISFNIIISHRENVVKLNGDVRQTSNVTGGTFKRRRVSDVSVSSDLDGYRGALKREVFFHTFFCVLVRICNQTSSNQHLLVVGC